MNFIKNLCDNNSFFLESNIILGAADFETVEFNNIHYIISIGLSFGKYRIWSLSKNNIEVNFSKFLFDKYSSILMFKFIRFIFTIKLKSIIYFHNLRGFDGIFILNFIVFNFSSMFSKLVRVIVRNGNIYSIRLNFVIFRCSLNFMCKGLNALSFNFFGFQKFVFDFGCSNYFNLNFKFFSFTQYLRSDVKLLFELIKIFFNIMYINFDCF